MRFRSLTLPLSSLASMLAVVLCVSSAGLAAPAAGAVVVLNEINCEGTDWVELVNTSDSPADVSGWLLTDDPLDANPLRADHRYLFPAATTIPPGGEARGREGGGRVPVRHQLRRRHDPSGGRRCGIARSMSSSVPPLAAAGDTWGRYPDGTGSWVETAPTKGSINEPSVGRRRSTARSVVALRSRGRPGRST